MFASLTNSPPENKTQVETCRFNTLILYSYKKRNWIYIFTSSRPSSSHKTKYTRESFCFRARYLHAVTLLGLLVTHNASRKQIFSRRATLYVEKKVQNRSHVSRDRLISVTCKCLHSKRTNETLQSTVLGWSFMLHCTRRAQHCSRLVHAKAGRRRREYRLTLSKFPTCSSRRDVDVLIK